MFDLVGGGLLGMVTGLAGRLVPEFVKFFDKKNERAHELAMFDRQCDLEKSRGQIRLDEIGAQRDAGLDVGALAAFKSAVESQAEMAKAAGGWAASLSASVRPVLTYYLLVLYGIAKASSGMPWGADDMALVSGAFNYWLADRTLSKRGLS